MSVDQLAVEEPENSITDDEATLGLSAYIAAATTILEREGFSFTVEPDLAGWCEVITSADRTDGRNFAFTPGESAPPDDAYWIKIVHASGRTAAIAAARFIDTELGFYDYVRSGKLWTPDDTPMKLEFDEPGPTGRLCHTGGIWVSPAYAGIGLSWIIARLNHAIAVRKWNLDHVFGCCFEKLISKGIAKNYGAENKKLMMTADFKGTGEQLNMFALENPRRHIEIRSRIDFVRIWNEPGKQMRHLAPFAKGKYEPPVTGARRTGND